MSKIVKQYAKLGIVPGARVDGLIAQSLHTVYAPLYGGPEEIVSIEPLAEDPDMVSIKTKELNARKTVLTTRGEVELKDEQRQYVMAGVELLKVIEKVDVKSVKGFDVEEKKALDISLSDAGIDTEFSTLPKELLQSLIPFVNYVNANKEELDDVIDVTSLNFGADGVTYDMSTLTILTKIE